MVGLSGPNAPTGYVPVTVTAWLQQGLAYDTRYGLALDGLLASVIRAHATHALGPQGCGSALDGGLGVAVPAEVDLPLARCATGGADWHWQASVGQPVDHTGKPVSLVPDTHRLLVSADERRAAQVAVRIPKNVGGPRGRYRTKVTPVLVVPAAAVVWHAVGDPDLLRDLLSPLRTVGARRGVGEGTVLGWEVTATRTTDTYRFAHTHPDGTLGRAVPVACARRLGFPTTGTGQAGLRPPLFHPARQRTLVLAGAHPEGT